VGASLSLSGLEHQALVGSGPGQVILSHVQLGPGHEQAKSLETKSLQATNRKWLDSLYIWQRWPFR
jgi:hypothetical protein